MNRTWRIEPIPKFWEVPQNYVHDCNLALSMRTKLSPWILDVNCTYIKRYEDLQFVQNVQFSLCLAYLVSLLLTLIMRFTAQKIKFFINLLTTNVPLHTETIQLICSVNQLTSFYMMGNIGRSWVKDFFSKCDQI